MSERSSQSFKYDHREYVRRGVDGWMLDVEASEAKEQAYLARRIARAAVKGHPHLCKSILSSPGELSNRQQRRYAERQLAKEEARGMKPCHGG